MRLAAFFVAALFAAAPCRAEILEELWQKYSGMEAPRAETPQPAVFPGVILGAPQGKDESAFDYPWKFRGRSYEMHFENPEELARSIYSLALAAGDVSPDLPLEKFYGGVLGFHYSIRQAADWLNNALKNGKALSAQESRLAGRLLLDDALKIGPDGFAPAGGIDHILGSAPGQKRSFAANLRHERLHVYWDENPDFRQEREAQWRTLAESEKDNIRKELKNYNQGNESQLIEEWAIKRAEKESMPIK